MSTQGSNRELVLKHHAAETARAWIQEVYRDLLRERREIDGAWPGTLSEARARAGEALRRATLQGDMPGPAAGELELVATVTSAEARREWR